MLNSIIIIILILSSPCFAQNNGNKAKKSIVLDSTKLKVNNIKFIKLPAYQSNNFRKNIKIKHILNTPIKYKVDFIYYLDKLYTKKEASKFLDKIIVEKYEIEIDKLKKSTTLIIKKTHNNN